MFTVHRLDLAVLCQPTAVPGHPEIFAIGDCANYAAGLPRPLPGLAPVAKQQGRYVGRLLKACLQGRREPRPFHYHNWGTMAIVGRSHAIADFGRLRFKGFFAWLTWSLVHLMLLVDFRSRLVVYLNWSWAFFTYGRGARLLAGSRLQPPAPAHSDTSPHASAAG